MTGAKPEAFCRWVLDLLGYDDTQDTIDDLFPEPGCIAGWVTVTLPGPVLAMNDDPCSSCGREHVNRKGAGTQDQQRRGDR